MYSITFGIMTKSLNRFHENFVCGTFYRFFQFDFSFFLSHIKRIFESKKYTNKAYSEMCF